jgi:hypothetical protein
MKIISLDVGSANTFTLKVFGFVRLLPNPTGLNNHEKTNSPDRHTVRPSAWPTRRTINNDQPSAAPVYLLHY